MLALLIRLRPAHHSRLRYKTDDGWGKTLKNWLTE